MDDTPLTPGEIGPREANEDFIYKASAWQQEYHNLVVDEALGAGAQGPGKSLALLNDCNPRIQREHFRCLAGTGSMHLVPESYRALCEEYPLRWGYSQGWAIHFRRTRPMLNQTISRSRRIFLALDPGASYNSDDTTWTFTSGYKYTFGHCRNPGDWDIYLSNEYDWMGFDELPQFNEEQYNQLTLRCRSGDPLLRKIAYVRSMGNPVIARELDDNFSVDDPGWVKRYFIDPATLGRQILKREVKRKDGRVEWLTRIFVPATLYDNPDKEFVEVQERKLLGAPQHIRDAYLHGKWDVMVGSHFGEEWNPRFHVIPKFRVPTDWPVFRSLDWGYKAPGQVMWWAMDPDDNLICINEVRFQRKTPRDVCRLIEKYERPNGWWKGRKSLLSGPADTQIWEDRGDSHTFTKYQDFKNHGVRWVQADKKSRFRNAELVMERLTDHDNFTTTPGLVFVDSCHHIIRTLPAIPSCKPPNQEMPQEGGDDHAYDACIAEAIVATLAGPRKIEDLRWGDAVLSTDGRYWPCTGATMTRPEARLFRLRFSDGNLLLATADHRLLCADGVWRRVDEIDSSCYAFAPWIRSSSLQHVRNFEASASIYAGAIFAKLRNVSEEADSYIERYGRQSTAQSLLATTSTIEMKIGLTIGSPICRPYPRQCTPPYIHESDQGHRSSTRRTRLGLGMQARKASPGILPMQRGALQLYGENAERSASSAERHSLIGAQAKGGNSAARHAALNGDANQGSMTWPEYALPAGMSSWSADSRVRPPVLGRAQRVESVRYERTSEVWCTTVPVMGAFVASGIVVSNCAYAVAFVSNGRKVIRMGRREEDAWDESEQRRPKPKQRGYAYGRL